jgi:maltooligosyltrehalose trehalohydrolase
MKHVHVMPFGAEPLPTGGTLFRLWAPAAKKVEVVIESSVTRTVPLQARDDGWYECTVMEAGGNDRYRYRIDEGMLVPDPASRFNPFDVHSASQLVDASTFEWDEDWKARPWREAIIYEMHIGTFTAEGTYAAAAEKLSHLANLGITAIELMPLSDFPGERGWGYDGVLHYAPEARYGTPWDLKHFIQAAHRAGLMVLLDVVYNHFGPDGNYMHVYAPQFFTDRHHTPWGKGMDFDGEHSNVVREFFVHNALYWLEEYRFDGLRLDAVHAILDDSPTSILQELSARVREVMSDREVHLILENADNAAERLGAARAAGVYDAQWNDDFHHVLHVLLTGQTDGYYAAFSAQPLHMLGRILTEGFAYQGEVYPGWDGATRGQASGHLPPTAFVSFLQNHDQIGNRAFGDRLVALAEPDALRAGVSILLLSPQIPLLFMGEEFGAATPFLYFCDFEGDLASAVTEGRRKEFAGFTHFTDWSAIARIPDPNAESTFRASKLDWGSVTQPPHSEWLAYYRQLIALRRARIVPLIEQMQAGRHRAQIVRTCGLTVDWALPQGWLRMQASLGHMPTDMPPLAGEIIFSHGQIVGDRLGPWAVRWSLDEGRTDES